MARVQLWGSRRVKSHDFWVYIRSDGRNGQSNVALVTGGRPTALLGCIALSFYRYKSLLCRADSLRVWYHTLHLHPMEEVSRKGGAAVEKRVTSTPTVTGGIIETWSCSTVCLKTSYLLCSILQSNAEHCSAPSTELCRSTILTVRHVFSEMKESLHCVHKLPERTPFRTQCQRNYDQRAAWVARPRQTHT